MNDLLDEIKTKYREDTFKMLKEIEFTYYNQSEMKTINDFIVAYSSSNFTSIRFDWNNKHSKDFIDANAEYRSKVSIYYILHCDDNTNPLLLKDLFCEQSKHDEEAWGASGFLFMLGEKLLSATGSQYIYEFLESAMRSFDTYGCCSSIRLDDKLVNELGLGIEELIEISSGNRVAIKLLNDGLEYINNFLS